MTIILVLVPILFFIIIGGIAFYFIKKTTPVNIAEENNPNSIQDFLPIENIVDGYVILKDKKLRKVIECSSTNYNLKTEDEQSSIDMIFQRFLNSLSFPISIFLQTRVIDNTKRMRILREDVDKVKRTFPELENYGNKYINAMDMINEAIGNSLEKKKFIIVPYDEEVNMASITKEERDDYIKKEIDNRCIIVLNGLSTLGISASVLKTQDLVELFYSTLNRDDYGYSDNLTKDEALSYIVEGEEDVFKIADYKKNIRTSLTSALNIYEANSSKLSKEDLKNEETIRNVYKNYKKDGA